MLPFRDMIGTVARVAIDLDEELLAVAAEALGTTTPTGTVSAALALVVARGKQGLRFTDAVKSLSAKGSSRTAV